MMNQSSGDEQGRSVDWQIPVQNTGDKHWDVLIIGAGPAGSTAAFHLSRRGYRVLLVDMAQFPRRKVCGDCMLTDVEANLASVGLLQPVREAGQEISGITIYSPSRYNFTIPGDFVTLKRPVLDALLARRAVDEGAVFAAGQVMNLEVEADESISAEIKGMERPVKARIAIIATGAHIALAKRLGAVANEKPSAIAMRCYIKSSHKYEQLVLCYERHLLPGYGWIVPLGNDEYNVGCGYFLSNSHTRNMRRCFDDFVAGFPPLRKLMEGAQILAPPRSGAIRCGLTGVLPLYRRSVILAGETIGTTYPLTGEGIGQAMCTGAVAGGIIAEALDKNDRQMLKRYPVVLKEKLKPRHEGFRHAQKWMSRPWLNDFMTRRVIRSRYLQKACLNFVSNNQDPRQVYSLKAVIRSFLG